jgi:hypothetical protein
MIKKICYVGALLLSGVCWLKAADEVETSSSVKIVEERKVIETRKVYETPAAKAPRKTAIFVDNRTTSVPNTMIQYFEDQVASRVSGKHFSVISREDVLKAVKVYATEKSTPQVVSTSASSDRIHVDGPDSHFTTTSKKTETVVDGPTDQNEAANRNSLGTKADRILSDNGSALRLAQSMGADFVLFVTIGSYARETKNLNDPSIGVKTRNIVYNLRGTYKVVEGVTGGGLGGDAYRCGKTVRQTDTLQSGDEDVLNGLLEDAAGKIADGLEAKADSFVAPGKSGLVEISVACGVKDLAGNEVGIPDIRVNEDNKIVMGDKELPVNASATVEVDGFAMGTTPCKCKVAPGTHRLRLTRPGFTDVDLTINATEGLSLSPTMQMSAQGFARWQDIRNFLNKLDITRKITDAQAEEIRGNAQRLRQSGFLVDYRINSTNAPNVYNYRSIYSVP